MSDQNVASNNADEAPNAAPPAVPVSEEPAVKVSVQTTQDDIPAADADVKENEEKSVEKTNGNTETKISETVKDPKEDLIGWINSLCPKALHKVNYYVMKWLLEIAVDDAEKRQQLLGKTEALTKSQFLGILRDGSVLAKLVKVFRPESAQTIYEGEDAKDKEKQTSNIQVFLNFMKESIGIQEDQLFAISDLTEKGKSGYQAVLKTILQLGSKVNEKFGQKGIDIDKLFEVVSLAVSSGIMTPILNFFRRGRPMQVSKQLSKDTDEKEKTIKTSKSVEKVVEEKNINESSAAAEQTAVPVN